MQQLFQLLFTLSRQNKALTLKFFDGITLFISLSLSQILLGYSLTMNVLLLNTALTGIGITLLQTFGAYHIIIRAMNMKSMNTISTGLLLLTICVWLSHGISMHFDWRIGVLNYGLALSGIIGARLLVYHTYIEAQKNLGIAVAIYGAGDAGRQLYQSLLQTSTYRPVIFIDDDPTLNKSQIGGLKIKPLSDIDAYLNKLNVALILFAIPSLSTERRSECIAQLAHYNIPIKSLPRLEDMINGQVNASNLKPVTLEELLGRTPVPAQKALLEKQTKRQHVLVTGAGGSIGQALCHEILKQNPKTLILVDHSEYALYQIQEKLTQQASSSIIIPKLLSVTDEYALQQLLNEYPVDTLYHAAAYKHVPLVEANPIIGLNNNVLSTYLLANAAIAHNVKQFMLVSTDKAVRPTNIMGASKRIAELVCQAYAQTNSNTRFSMVRFGNVLGSSGSVIPKFQTQIDQGGPITVTHPDITRYFMTIAEAAQLVIQAGALSQGGEVFVLDMGQPIKISDLAKKMIQLQGLTPSESSTLEKPTDINITYCGLRPGEKLYEELLIDDTAKSTAHPKILVANEAYLALPELKIHLESLLQACRTHDMHALHNIMQAMPLAFNHEMVSI